MNRKRSIAIRVAPDEIERAVRVVRGQRVMLDFDLARLYGVTTAALNQAVQRNADRFLDDFAYQLTQQEVAGLMSQIVISKQLHDEQIKAIAHVLNELMEKPAEPKAPETPAKAEEKPAAAPPKNDAAKLPDKAPDAPAE